MKVVNKLNIRGKYIFLFIYFIILLIFSGVNLLNSLENICNVSKEIKNISGNSMYPMLNNNDDIIFLNNYYKICGKNIHKGDIIMYNRGGSERIIKVVKITNNDEVLIQGNNLKINGELMKNSIGQEYNFSDGEKKLLSLYIENGKIPKGSYMIFGDNIYNSLDSRKFGAISGEDILGKFELIKK